MVTIPTSAKKACYWIAGLLSLILVSGRGQAAEAVHFKSESKRTALVELFTSEGCSSCPPAEAWFSTLKTSPALWKEFVPVAYHVAYWDYLGWKDTFAQEQFTQRQRTYAASWHTDTVYTPGMVLNGKEWRAWHGSTGIPSKVQPDAGELEVSSADRRLWQIYFRPNAAIVGRLEVTLALLGSGLSSDVKAGENQGRKLAHDFVVIKLKQAPLSPKDGVLTVQVELPVEDQPRTTKLAVAAWITKSGSAEPLQATGGWLPK